MLTAGPKVLAILLVEMVEQVHNYQRHQSRQQNSVAPELHESGECLPAGSAEERRTLGISLFQMISNRPGTRHGFARINQHGYEALTRKSDHVFVGKAP